MDEQMSNISTRLKTVMDFSKGSTEEWNWRAVADALAPVYAHKMKLESVLQIVIGAYMEALDEKRFELGDKDQAVLRLSMAAVKGTFSIDMMGPASLEVKYGVEDWFNAQIKTVLSDLRCARIDWLQAGEQTAKACASTA